MWVLPRLTELIGDRAGPWINFPALQPQSPSATLLPQSAFPSSVFQLTNENSFIQKRNTNILNLCDISSLKNLKYFQLDEPILPG